MPQKRMTGMENLLGGWFGVKRRKPLRLMGESNVSWLAVTEDYDLVDLRDKHHARSVARSGYVDDVGGSRPVIKIRRNRGSDRRVFYITNGIMTEAPWSP